MLPSVRPVMQLCCWPVWEFAARFPGRDIIVFLAVCAIFATLVLLGTTLGWMNRRLGLEQEETALPEPDTANARAELAAASLDAVQDHLDSNASGHGEAAAELVEEYEVRAERARIEGQDVETKTDQLIGQQRLRLVAIGAAREKLMEHTDQIDAEAHRALGEELDLWLGHFSLTQAGCTYL